MRRVGCVFAVDVTYMLTKLFHAFEKILGCNCVGWSTFNETNHSVHDKDLKEGFLLAGKWYADKIYLLILGVRIFQK